MYSNTTIFPDTTVENADNYDAYIVCEADTSNYMRNINSKNEIQVHFEKIQSNLTEFNTFLSKMRETIKHG